MGFDTYVRLLEETVRELKGEEVLPEIHATLNLGLDIRIPQTYIADEHQRLRAYKRMSEATSEDDAQRIAEELQDRYGPPPDAVLNLLRFSVLKTVVEKAGVEAIDRRSGMLNIKFHEHSRVDPGKLLQIVTNNRWRAVHTGRRIASSTTGLDTPEKMIAYLTRLFV